MSGSFARSSSTRTSSSTRSAAAHRYREPGRDLLRRQGGSALAGGVTPVVVAEVMHQRLRQTGDRTEAARRAEQIALICRVHAPGAADAELAGRLYSRASSLDAFDALLAAVALNRGIDAVLSADRAFDAVEGIHRVDPIDADRVASLS